MYLDLFAQRTKFFKETEEGVSYMCKIMEDMRNDTKTETIVQVVLNMLEDESMPHEKIAKFTNLPVEKIEEIAASAAAKR